MGEHTDILDWIAAQKEAMETLAVRWANVNSHTANVEGVGECCRHMAEAFGVFKEEIKRIDLPDYPTVNARGDLTPQPAAPVLSLVKRPEAQKQALLVCHADTVYPSDGPFREVQALGNGRINGPGITDAKGGIVIMLKALEAVERIPLARNVGWRVIINTDEEIGSPSSSKLLEEAAKAAGIGLVFEPAFADGRLVGARKGSGNFTLVAKGRAAHAGRDHAEGRNAIDAVARCVTRISAFTNTRPGLTVNFGTVTGGQAANVVADRAVARFNVRYAGSHDQKYLSEAIDRVITDVAGQTGVALKVHGNFSAPPKPLSGQTLALFEHVRACAGAMGLELDWKDSGGVCDGNRLQAAGLPTVDTLGAVGGNIHSSDEYMETASLVERAQLTALVLLGWAEGKWKI